MLQSTIKNLFKNNSFLKKKIAQKSNHSSHNYVSLKKHQDFTMIELKLGKERGAGKNLRKRVGTTCSRTTSVWRITGAHWLHTKDFRSSRCNKQVKQCWFWSQWPQSDTNITTCPQMSPISLPTSLEEMNAEATLQWDEIVKDWEGKVPTGHSGCILKGLCLPNVINSAALGLRGLQIDTYFTTSLYSHLSLWQQA